ncbi:peptidoglycan-binding protein [Kribbella sp. VKM Ac-2568]|uniref:peptidoglycan-binding domain-containing protein n=1 Tax=Kribbella sp. VKM Ac-2568 TaxID=2512219 RepID=UPI0010515FC7|nr:peptidoglycan-binding domain-containing protein [Kribbella sp. VKM Ac-2568]TCM41902.1 putative peptidoglycan binding protein [Kribbella sp. VKM Ac-2568]
MAVRIPSLRNLSLFKLTPRKAVAVVAILVSPIAVAAVAASGNNPPKEGSAASGGAAPAVQPPKADSAEAKTDAQAETRAAAALTQCRSARLVPVGKTGWGVPMPSVWNSPSTTCNLMSGDDPYRGSARTGDPDTAIRTLQRNLNYCYGYRLTVDGVYGSNTRGVVKAVQKRHKLTADGIYGPNTRSAMNWRLFSSKTNTWSKACSSPL